MLIDFRIKVSKYYLGIIASNVTPYEPNSGKTRLFRFSCRFRLFLIQFQWAHFSLDYFLNALLNCGRNVLFITNKNLMKRFTLTTILTDTKRSLLMEL